MFTMVAHSALMCIPGSTYNGENEGITNLDLPNVHVYSVSLDKENSVHYYRNCIQLPTTII